MSSLRPLVTITLLAAVGVFLYMKINETEPPLPAGVTEWAPDSLEIGEASDAGGMISSSPAAAPPAALPSTSAGSEAPPFAAPAPAANSLQAANQPAPAWTPQPLEISEPETAASADDQSSPVARTAEAPATPPMPPLPSTGGGAPAQAPNAAPGPSETAAAPAGIEPSGVAEVDRAGATAAAATALAAGAAAAQGALNDGGPDIEIPAAETAGTSAATAPAPTTPASATPSGPDGSAIASVPAESATVTTPTPEEAPGTSPGASMFAAARVAVQGALDRGELAQALLLLSDWYDDPSLTPEEAKEVEGLLGQLAGSVIYDGPPAHRLEKAYIVQAGETLETIAAKYDVPWQLLAKINNVAQPTALQPGQELKVVRGPFSALVDLSQRRMTLMLDRRYAGQFAIELDPTSTIEEGQWKVDQKLLTPAAAGLYGPPQAAGEERSLLLASLSNPTGTPAVLRGPGAADPVAAEPRGRVIRLRGGDVNDVYDILSEGSRVTIRR